MALWSTKPTKAATPRTVAPEVISNIFLRVMLTSISGLISPHFHLVRTMTRRSRWPHAIEPFAFVYQLTFDLADEHNRPAENEKSEMKKVAHQFADLAT